MIYGDIYPVTLTDFYENFRKLDQKKIHFSKNKIHLWSFFCIINNVLVFSKNKYYCKIFF